MKKTLAALTLAVALLTVPAAAAFSDVDEGLYYAAPIAWAVEEGITTGTTETTFSPDALCTQGQILTFLWRAAGSPEEGNELPPALAAETLNQDFQKAIAWAIQENILEEGEIPGGVDSGFHPSAPCNRGTAMYFLWRYMGAPASDTPVAFTDVAPNADYAQAVAWAVEAGITAGTTENTFSPLDTCTRGQIATFLYRGLNDAAPAPEEPEVPTAPAETGEPVEEKVRPQRTLTGQGKARSLGLDGSEFTSEETYEAEVTVDVYSPVEAVFTIQVPFPLFQACSYTVLFEDANVPGTGYMFRYDRWDEAFADIIPWEGEHNHYCLTDMSGEFLSVPFAITESNDDRIGGVVSWRLELLGDPEFNFNRLSGYTVSCDVRCNL